MRGISDHGLIKISDLHPNVALRIGQGTKVANVTVAANPNRGTFRQLAATTAFQPFAEFDGTTPHVSVRGLCHLQIPSLGQNPLAVIGICHAFLDCRLDLNPAKQN